MGKEYHNDLEDMMRQCLLGALSGDSTPMMIDLSIYGLNVKQMGWFSLLYCPWKVHMQMWESMGIWTGTAKQKNPTHTLAKVHCMP